MSSFEDHQAAVQRSLLPGRLLKGAEIMGKLWRDRVRCSTGWARSCGCGVAETLFCKAKAQWTAILDECGKDRVVEGVHSDEPFHLLEVMTLRELKATGITLAVRFPGGDTILFGPKGTTFEETWPGLFDDAGPRPDVVKVVARVQSG